MHARNLSTEGAISLQKYNCTFRGPSGIRLTEEHETSPMCGRYTLTLESDDLEERFDATLEEEFSPRYNAAPGQRLPVITDAEPETVQRLEWGLVPSWADDDTGGIINARAETINKKPSFREAYEQRRCLVPADGFYEWVETEDGKQPYRVALEDDRPFAMAGLWERWEPDEETTQAGLEAFGGGSADAGRDDDPLETFTVVTTEPNDLVGDLHHRMAVILEPGDEREWLMGDDPKDLLEPYPADEMRAYPVSRAVNDPSTDEPSLLEPIES
ncbi:Putative SOS response-associated peptidase YedK [Natronobacterium texcoconense]|uniref:Putative SOS response-associated peptidase YedK n=2 Tax=Natronobacterium texcoconense TaxID=1095778 RepID=A0A1H1ICH6_NATTX|nr:Putative SOS response-associated peptidase YedK [Natronobacterium texcoconense]